MKELISIHADAVEIFYCACHFNAQLCLQMIHVLSYDCLNLYATNTNTIYVSEYIVNGNVILYLIELDKRKIKTSGI